ncbi:dynein heavy chain domain-containing protein 1-like, partial [Rhinoderma darwinii]|uniref:dynein heavy chain domain-containing protein 1-like n=1 Tax=Rhinoderma darwinii TaxID=43563 RepID=UPI003F671791
MDASVMRDQRQSVTSSVTHPNTEHGSPVHLILGGQYLRQVIAAPSLPPGHCKEMPMPGELRIKGQQQRAHYLPLRLQSLRYMLHCDCPIQEARKKLQRLLEDSLKEVKDFCEEHAWMSDIRCYVQSWSPHILEKLRGSSARDYEDLILKLQHWEQRVCGLKDCVTTAMLEVTCELLHTQTGPVLGCILQDILVLLTSEVAEKSHYLIYELSEALQIFSGVSTEISSFSKCAHKVSEYNMKRNELEEQVEYVVSLREVIRAHYRQQTAEEQKVKCKLTDSWDMFQHFLKTSAEFLSRHLSSMSGSLEQTFRACYKEAEDVITESGSARYQDPGHNETLMLRDLSSLHHNLSSVLSQLRDFSHSRQVLQGKTFDLSAIAVGERQVQAREESWKVLSGCKEQIAAWKLRPFMKVKTERMREKLQRWEENLQDLTPTLGEGDPILQSIRGCLQDFSQHLPLLRALRDPAVEHEHWVAIFAVMGKTFIGLETLTLTELLSCPLLKEQEQIHKILLRARAEFSVLQDFRKIQTFWQEKEFRLVRFFLCVSREDPPPDQSKRPPSGKFRDHAKGYRTQDSGTFLLADRHSLFSLMDDSLLSLQTIRCSPFSAGQHDEISGWIQKLQTLGQVLNLWVTFQGKWVFLSKVQSEMDIPLPRTEMVTEFQSIDRSYRSFLEVTVQDPLVLSILNPNRRHKWPFHGDLCSVLQSGISVMENIIVTMGDVLYSSRCDFPPLFFLSDQDVIDVLAASPDPSDRLPCALLCFPQFTSVLFQAQSSESSGFPLIGGHSLTVGVIGSYGETLDLTSPISWNPKTVSWLIELEQRVRGSLKEQLTLCLTECRLSCFHQPTHLADLRRWVEHGMSHPLQCLIVTEEVVWCEDVEKLILTDHRSDLREWHNLKIEILVQKLREAKKMRQSSPASAHQEQAFLSAWITLAVRQRDRTLCLLNTGIQTLDSFSWAKLMKYRAPTQSGIHHLKRDIQEDVSETPPISNAEEHPHEVPSSPLCFVDVLGHYVPYGHEYVGLDMKMMDSAVSERTSLGLILALEHYQCGAMIGQDEGLRTQTLLALGRALGRQVVMLKCWAGLNFRRLTLHLEGALQGGAWLVLDNAHRLKYNVLASLGQLLFDTQSSCEALMKEGQFYGCLDTTDRTAAIIGNIQFEQRTCSVRRNYGCIMTLPHMSSSLALPSNLHLLLRPVSFCPPDLHSAAELAFLSAGFQEHSLLAKKLSYFLRLAEESGAVTSTSAFPLLRNIVQKAIVLLKTSAVHECGMFDRGAMRSPGDTDRCHSPFHMDCEGTTVTTGLQEEKSVVTALLGSTLWSNLPVSAYSHLMDILKSVFIMYVSPLPSSPTAAALSSALQLHLHESGLEAHTELSNNVMGLFQAIQQSSGVLLTGPSGSGKSTCWKALQQALNHLAANREGTEPEAILNVPTSPSYQSVHSVHLFPNSLSPAEFLGEGKDNNGVFSNLLHRAGEESAVQRWIVLDGSAALTWVEPISCLFGPQPVFTLADGQQLHLPDRFKLLFEMPDTSALSPAMSTLCSFVYCGGQETWRTILKACLSSLYIRYRITRSTEHKLQTLSERLIPSTLCYLEEHCTPILHPHTAQPPQSARGVHQVSSFSRILHALMDQHLPRDNSHQFPEQTEDVTDDEESHSTARGCEEASPLAHQDHCVPSENHQRAQTFFLYAFIWAFGGPL